MTDLNKYPPAEQWHDWTELDAKAWPDKVEKNYTLVPTTCFNCEAGCGLVAYHDKETGEIRKIEGNPHHPGSRGRNCAKGPATINQIYDTERVMFPLRRVGERGSGQWERISWEEALTEVGEKIRTAFVEGRKNGVMYHVGRPGEEGYTDRVLKAWGVDGHNSHTNICSSNARIGYQSWMGHDRPSSDFANAKVIFLISSHLESGHYFNPHAQRIIEAQANGAKVIACDPRRFPTPVPKPTTEAAHVARHRPFLLLSIARLLIESEGMERRVRRAMGQLGDLPEGAGPGSRSSSRSSAPRCSRSTPSTPPRPPSKTGIDADTIREIAAVIGANQRVRQPQLGGPPAPATWAVGRSPAVSSS